MTDISRRAQGSVEFLMTYTWAFVIILVVVVVAWRWGLFSFSETVSPGTYGFWGVTPVDFRMDTGGTLRLSIQNDVGVNVTVNSIMVVSPINQTVTNGPGWVIEPGRRQAIDVNNLKQGVKGGRFDVFVVVNYSNSRMLPNRERLSSGIVWGPYE